MRFFATDGFTHFLRPGSTVNVQPEDSSFAFAAAEKARAFMFNLTLRSPSPNIYNKIRKLETSVSAKIMNINTCLIDTTTV